mmetsp:Transcript_19021/g.59538  ORF Transcript_19021/g.59538 Transcript_19021/m.59538 type:complete len:2321 (-) Transcript_19021:1867-8829(-)
MDLLPVCHRCRVAPETKQSEESLQRNGRAPCQPFVLDIHVLGSNLAAGQLSQIYLRVLFNGRFVANDPETASGPLVFTLATNLLSADDHLLVELWESMGKKKPILHAEQDKFLGEGQIFSGVLRNPPPHRIDLPLRPRESSGPESITGSLCVYLAPRTRGTKRHWQNQVQHPARALRNRHLVNITDPDRRDLQRDGIVPQRLVFLHLVAARGISQAATGASMEILYNRHRVALVEATNACCDSNEGLEFKNIVWNDSLLQFPASDAAAPGHRSVWPELQFVLWKLVKSDGLGVLSLGEVVLAGSKSVLATSPRDTSLRASPETVLPLCPRRGVFAASVSGDVVLSVHAVAEQTFCEEVARWGVDAFPCEMLALQIPGSRGGKDTDQASAAVHWRGAYIACTDSQAADRDLNRNFLNADFLLPTDVPSETRALRISMQARSAHRNATRPYLGHTCINIEDSSRLPSFAVAHPLQPKARDTSMRVSAMPCPPWRDRRESVTRANSAGTFYDRGHSLQCALPQQVRDARLLLQKQGYRDLDSQKLGSIIVRLHQLEANKSSSETMERLLTATKSHARLRITILALFLGSKRRPARFCTDSAGARAQLLARMKDKGDSKELSMVICYRRKGDLKPVEMTVSIAVTCQQAAGLIPVTEEILVWLPPSWATDWAHGNGALWIELRRGAEILGMAFSGSNSLSKVARFSSEANFSYLELLNRFNPCRYSTSESTHSKRLIQPIHASQKYDYLVHFPPFLVRNAVLHHRFVLEEVQLTERRLININHPNGVQLTERRATDRTAESRARLISIKQMLPRCAGDNVVSRLRVVVLGQTFLSQTDCIDNANKAPLDVGIAWCGKPVKLNQSRQSDSGGTLCLLPFGRGVAGAKRDGDTLQLTLASTDFLESLALSWAELRRLPSAQTDYNVEPPDARSPFDLSTLVATPPIEVEMPGICDAGDLMTLVHDRRGTVVSRAGRCSVTLQLVVEESSCSRSHALSMQLRGFASLQDPRDFRAKTHGPSSAAGRTRWLGSIQRWPYVSIFGPGLRVGFVRSKADCAHRQGRGSSPWNRSDLDVKHTLKLLPPARAWPRSATIVSSSTDIIVADFGEHRPQEISQAMCIQAWYRHRRASGYAGYIGIAKTAERACPSAVRIIQHAWRARAYSPMLPNKSVDTCVLAVASLQRTRRYFGQRCLSGAGPHPTGLATELMQDVGDVAAAKCQNHAVRLSVLGCDDLCNAGSARKANPYVAITLDGLKTNRTPTRHRTHIPRWDQHQSVLCLGGQRVNPKMKPAQSQEVGGPNSNQPRGSAHSSYSIFILLPKDRERISYAALAAASRRFDSPSSDTLTNAHWELYLVARLGDRAVCTDVIPTLQWHSNSNPCTQIKCGQVTYANVSPLQGSGGLLELEVWGRTNDLDFCTIRGQTLLHGARNAGPAVISMKINMMPSSGTTGVIPECTNSLLGEMRIAAALMAPASKTIEPATSSRPGLPPRRPPPDHFVHLVGFVLTRTLDSPDLQYRPHSSLDVYLQFTLGLCSQRSSVLSHGGVSAAWPAHEVITIASWHDQTSPILQIDILRDRAPCPSDLHGSCSVLFLSSSNRWQTQTVKFCKQGGEFNAALTFWITRTTDRTPVPLRSYFDLSYNAVRPAPRNANKSKFDIVKMNDCEFKIHNLVATSLPQTTVAVNRTCGSKQNLFIFARRYGQSARTTTKHCGETDCGWEGETLTLSTDCNVTGDHALPERLLDAELTVQIWNERSSGKDVLVGETRVALGACLADLGSEVSQKLPLARPPLKKGTSPRLQGTLSFSIVATQTPVFFHDAVEHDFNHLNELRVAVIQARNLPSPTRSDVQYRSSDPVVTLSCKGERSSSSVKRRSTCPIWNEVYSMRICTDHNSPAGDLNVTVSAWGASGNNLIGRVAIPLESLRDSVTKRKWHQLVGSSSEKPPDPSLSARTVFDLKGRRRRPRSRTEGFKEVISPRGEIQLALQWRYNAALDYFQMNAQSDEEHARAPNELLVALVRARGLRPPERGHFGPPLASPYAVLGFDCEVRQSRVVHGTLNPTWNERYRLSLERPADQTLRVEIFDWTPGSTTDLLASTVIHLNQLHDGRTLRRWYALSAPSADIADTAKHKSHKPGSGSVVSPHGEIELALRWICNPRLLPFGGNLEMVPNCLQVAVIRAKILHATDFRGTSNPSATVSLHSRHRLSNVVSEPTAFHRTVRRTTRVENNTAKPTWSDAFRIPCSSSVGPATDTAMPEELDLNLSVEVEYASYVGASSALGKATVDLESHLDRRPRRFWISVEPHSRTCPEERIVESHGKMELLLQRMPGSI